MEDSVIVVKISKKDSYLLDETSRPLRKNDFSDLINALKDAQKKTNDCLTSLTKDKEDTVSTEDKFDDLSEDDDSEEDSCCIVVEPENDISLPKRVKL